MNRYWIGDGGNWNDTAHWAETSGGAGGFSVPTSSDDVFFDANSFTIAGQAVIVNVASASFRNMDWTGALNTPTFRTNNTTNDLIIYGSLTFISAMVLSTGTGSNIFQFFEFAGSTSGNTITTAGNRFPDLDFYGTGEWTLQDNLNLGSGNSNSNLYISRGTLNTNGKTVTAYSFLSYINGIPGPFTLNLGSSLINVKYWFFTYGDYTIGSIINAGTSVITASGTAVNFFGGNFSYNTVFLGGTQGTIVDNNTFTYLEFLSDTSYQFFGSNTIGTLVIKAGDTVIFANNSTQTIGSLTAKGTSESTIITLKNESGITPFTLSVSASIVDGDWLYIKNNIATGGATFYAGAHSVNAGNVTGWNFQPYLFDKEYIYRVYDGGEAVEIWSNEVISDPKFRMNINNGPGELIIELARSFDDFGEEEDVKLNNKVECWVIDKDNPTGLLLYSGYISGYRPIVDREIEKVEVIVFGYAAELQRMMLRDASGNTTITYSSTDPSNMLKDIIDKYRSIGGTINYTATSIAMTNTSVSYTFNTNTVKECVDKIIELCPTGWFYRIDPDNIIYLQPFNIAADHQVSIGQEVERLSTFRRIEDTINRILFVGGGSPPLFKKYENTGSQDTYGLYEKKMVDQRVTINATAQIMAEREINTKKDPEIRSTLQLIDNNGPGIRGYDIESIKPGETIKILNINSGTRTQTLWDIALWDVDVWDQSLATTAADIVQILSFSYTPDSITIEASSRLPQIAKRIEDIQRNLENSQTVNNPTAPS